MGIPVMILGASASGKSSSLRNCDPNTIGVINVMGKPLPFRNNFKTLNTKDYEAVKRAIARGKVKTYIIDDSQYLLADEFISHANEKGYQKFTDIAVHFYDLITFISERTPPDCIVYLLHHTEADELGNLKAKTVGRMLDEKITVEGLFTIVLLCEMEAGEYGFRTRGKIPAKAPIGMFSERIDNDLAFVDRTIREYYRPAQSAEAKQGGTGNAVAD